MTDLPHWLGAELAPYADFRRDGQRVGDFVENLDPRSRAALGRLGMLVLRPEAFLDDTAVTIVERVRAQHGLQPIAVRLRQMSPRLLDSLYEPKLDVISSGLRVHHEVVATGPTAFVMFAGECDGESVAVYLDRVKGETSPTLEADASTIRGASRRPSSFHTVHTSEHAGDALQTAMLIFGAQAVSRHLALLAKGEVEPIPPLSIARLLVSPYRRQDVFALAAELKLRIVTILALESDAPSSVLDELSRVYTACESALTEIDDFRARRDRYIEAVRAARPSVEALIRALEATLARYLDEMGEDHTLPDARWRRLDSALVPLKLAYAFWALCGFENYDRDDGEAVVTALREGSIVLSPPQATLLTVALLCDINPSSAFRGVRAYPLERE